MYLYIFAEIRIFWLFIRFRNILPRAFSLRRSIVDINTPHTDTHRPYTINHLSISLPLITGHIAIFCIHWPSTPGAPLLCLIHCLQIHRKSTILKNYLVSIKVKKLPNINPDSKYNKSRTHTANGRMGVEKFSLKERNISMFRFCVRSGKNCLSVFLEVHEQQKTILYSSDLHNRIILQYN